MHTHLGGQLRLAEGWWRMLFVMVTDVMWVAFTQAYVLLWGKAVAGIRSLITVGLTPLIPSLLHFVWSVANAALSPYLPLEHGDWGLQLHEHTQTRRPFPQTLLTQLLSKDCLENNLWLSADHAELLSTVSCNWWPWWPNTPQSSSDQVEQTKW